MQDQPLDNSAHDGQSKPFGRLDLFVVAVGVILTAAVATVHRATPLGGFSLAMVVAVSTWLAVIDFRVHRLPNRIVGPLAAAVTIGLLIAGFVEDDMARAWRAIGLGLITAFILLIANLVGGLGMGDVKYGFPMAATVGWFGWDALFVALLVTTFAGAVVAVIVLLAKRGKDRHLAYGPYMALGLAVSLITCC